MMSSRQIIAHSLFLGFCASLIILVTKPSSSLVFTFFATSSCYVFLRLSLLKKVEKTRSIVVAIILAACALGAAMSLSKDQNIIAAFSVVILIPYVIPGKISSRNQFLLKPVTIGICWAMMTVGLAFDNNPFFLPNDRSVFEIFIQIFILTFILSLLYDYRDKIFIPTKERTIPYFFSEKSFYSILWIALVVSFVAFILIGENIHAGIAFFTTSIFILFLFRKMKSLGYSRATWLTDTGFVIYATTYAVLNVIFD